MDAIRPQGPGLSQALGLTFTKGLNLRLLEFSPDEAPGEQRGSPVDLGAQHRLFLRSPVWPRPQPLRDTLLGAPAADGETEAWENQCEPRKSSHRSHALDHEAPSFVSTIPPSPSSIQVRLELAYFFQIHASLVFRTAPCKVLVHFNSSASHGLRNPVVSIFWCPPPRGSLLGLPSLTDPALGGGVFHSASGWQD